MGKVGKTYDLGSRRRIITSKKILKIKNLTFLEIYDIINT